MMRNLAVSRTFYVVPSLVLLSFTLVTVFRVAENRVPRLLEGVPIFLRFVVRTEFLTTNLSRLTSQLKNKLTPGHPG